jgi:oligoribonuclease
MIIWLDLETTGLDPETDVILEVGAVVTDDDLNVLEQYAELPSIGEATWRGVKPSDVVYEMHRQSGLWEARNDERRKPPLAVVEWKLLRIVDEFTTEGWTAGELIPLGGSSVGFDRAFCKRYLPEFEAALHYRNVDISAVRELARRWRPDLTEREPEARKLHRVIPDLDDTLALARFYRDELFDPAPDYQRES